MLIGIVFYIIGEHTECPCVCSWMFLSLSFSLCVCVCVCVCGVCVPEPLFLPLCVCVNMREWGRERNSKQAFPGLVRHMMHVRWKPPWNHCMWYSAWVSHVSHVHSSKPLIILSSMHWNAWYVQITFYLWPWPLKRTYCGLVNVVILVTYRTLEKHPILQAAK